MRERGTSSLNKAPRWINEWIRDKTAFSPPGAFHLNVDSNERYATWVAEENESAVVLWHMADWDTEQLGVRCAKVERVLVKSDRAEKRPLFSKLFSEIPAQARQQGIENLFYRVSPYNEAAIRSAEDAGFRTIGIRLDFSLPFTSAAPEDPVDKHVRTADKQDVDDLVRAAEVFRDDRFHRDGGFSEKRITGLWQASVKNALHQWADVVYVYEDAGGFAGFLVLTGDRGWEEKKPKPQERIFLIAVLPEFRRRGIGKALIRAAVSYSRENGAPGLLVGTQCNNWSAISLYQSSGFRLDKVNHELSWWAHEKKW